MLTEESPTRLSKRISGSIDRSDLGYSGSRDPTRDGISRKKADQLIEDLMRDVEAHIAEKLMPALRSAIAEQLGEPTDGNWSLEIDDADPHSVNFHYPTVLPETEYVGMAYITPRVRLEFGARGDVWPAEMRVIRAYAAEDYPDFFQDSDAAEFLATLLRPRHAPRNSGGASGLQRFRLAGDRVETQGHFLPIWLGQLRHGTSWYAAPCAE